MSASAIAAICMLLSAFGHAVMNTFNKEAEDKVLFRAVFLLFGGIFCLPLAVVLTPPSPQVWMHLGISFVLHSLYTYTLMNSLQRGDMGLVYPIMRGLAPVLTAVVALVFLKESLPPLGIAALIGASLVLIAFAWPEKGGELNRPAIIFAMLTAVMIAGYSVNDAAGVRAMKEAGGGPFSYIAWFFVSVSLPIASFCLWLRRRAIRTEVPKIIKQAAFVSVAGFISYSLALYAFMLAPVAVMSSLRETSVVFGAILAALVLKEPFGQRRIIFAILLALFLVLLQAA
jgi:drug/metabolite transporter (DMT)-like permease